MTRATRTARTARTRWTGWTTWSLACALLAVVVCAPACKKKVSQPQCDALIDRFATLVVTERTQDASPEIIKAEQERERHEARSDESFRNCTSEVEQEDYDCAMKSDKSNAFLKCLE